MRRVINLFKYFLLAAFILLAGVLIIESSLPGAVSAQHSDSVVDVVVDVVVDIVENTGSAPGGETAGGSQGGGSTTPGQGGSQGGGSTAPGQSGSQGGGSTAPGQDGSQGGGSTAPGQSGSQGGGSTAPGQGEEDTPTEEENPEDENTTGEGEEDEKTQQEIIELIESVTGISFDEFRLLIRKSFGHFGAFLLLALIGTMAFTMLIKTKPIAFSMVFVTGVFVAVLTEVIQLFVPGRYGTLNDVILDSAGYIIGFIFILLIYFIIKIAMKLVRKTE